MIVRTITGFAGQNQDVRKIDEQVQSLAGRFQASGWSPQTTRLTTDVADHCLTVRELEKELIRVVDMLPDIRASIVHLGSFSVSSDLLFSSEARQLIIDSLGEHKKLNITVDLGDEYPIDPRRCLAAAELCLALSSFDPFDCFNFATYAYVQESTPFYPASRVLTNSGRLAIGVQSADVAVQSIDQTADPQTNASRIRNALNQTYGEIEALAKAELKERYLGLDTSMAPFPEDQYSTGHLIELLSAVPFGGPGTLAACRLLTSCMKQVAVQRTGLNGLMLPPLEDHILARRYAEGTYSVRDLMLFSTVCATGLDTVVISADEGVEKIARLYCDVATLAVTLKKPLSVRLMVVRNKKPGDMVHLDSEYVCDCPVMKL